MNILTLISCWAVTIWLIHDFFTEKFFQSEFPGFPPIGDGEAAAWIVGMLVISVLSTAGIYFEYKEKQNDK